VLVVSELVVGGIWGILRIPYVNAVLAHLGYPAYLNTILGVWSLFGAVALLVPRFPRLKEWAYAGMVFNFTGAVASHLAVGDSVVTIIYPIFLIGLVAASWALRPASRRDLAPR
jgi:hypothetical protein